MLYTRDMINKSTASKGYLGPVLKLSLVSDRMAKCIPLGTIHKVHSNKNRDTSWLITNVTYGILTFLPRLSEMLSISY